MALYQMADNLYVSADTRKFSAEQKLNVMLGKNIRTVVNMTKKCTDSDFEKWKAKGLVDYIMLRVNDAMGGLPTRETQRLIDMAKELHKRCKTEGVLIHCYGGENRSCLLAGLVLIESGMTGTQAVQRIKSVRPSALYNPAFHSYLIAFAAQMTGRL
jgi:predicted protein tyrosine phosphatase